MCAGTGIKPSGMNQNAAGFIPNGVELSFDVVAERVKRFDYRNESLDGFRYKNGELYIPQH